MRGTAPRQPLVLQLLVQPPAPAPCRWLWPCSDPSVVPLVDDVEDIPDVPDVPEQLDMFEIPDTHDDPELIEYRLADWVTRASTLYELADPGTLQLLLPIEYVLAEPCKRQEVEPEVRRFILALGGQRKGNVVRV